MSAKENKELLEQILKEINSLKTALTEIRAEVAKLSQIENKLKKGENLATNRNGWFWSY
tara:strand:+ start:39 stop:215 length:177 start_codon:yes stop_codon:yes gene_type:complete